MLERLPYSDGGTALTGWLARPAGKARAALVIYPTIANVNSHMERRATMLAETGFAALIADYYGEPVGSIEVAGKLAAALKSDVDAYRRRLSAAIAALSDTVPGQALGAIGYCMGGQAALEMARAGQALRLVASFHGLLETGRKADNPIAPRILVCHGDADPMVPRDHVFAFWQEMDAVKADWHFHAYSGVKHGFTDPESDARGLPAIGYDASADRQSWAAMMNLANEVFV